MINKSEKEIAAKWDSFKRPVVSVACITYNHESYIEKALDSILMQETDFPFEVIIRDDCSTDMTAKIVKEYTIKYPNIIKTIFEKENQFSKGINPFMPVYNQAVGKYVAILEGDDYWRDPLKLQKQKDFLDKNEEYILTYHNSIIVNELDELISDLKNPNAADYTSEQMLCGEAFILTNTVMFRKVDLPQLTENKVLNGDTLMWHLLGHYGKAKYQEDVISAAYRIHSGGIWSSLDKLEKFKKALEIKRYLRSMLKDNNKLANHITKKIPMVYATWIYNTTRSLDFKSLKEILSIMKEDKEVNNFFILILLPKCFLKDIKSKINS